MSMETTPAKESPTSHSTPPTTEDPRPYGTAAIRASVQNGFRAPSLNVLYRQGTQTPGFRAALAFYPGCGPKALLAPALATAAPVTMFLASEDEEVSPASCQRFAERSRNAGSPVDVVLYPGATHGFDDPGAKRQSLPANRTASADAFRRALAGLQALRTR